MDDRFEIVHIYRCCVIQTFSDGRNTGNCDTCDKVTDVNLTRGSLTTTTNQSTSEWLDVKQMVNLEVTFFLFTRKVRVISHKSELCSHFKAYFEEQ